MKMITHAGVLGVGGGDEGNLPTIYIYMTFIYMFCWFLKRLA